MYYRKNDSRMGDEVFAMGLLLAPFVWKLVKKGSGTILAKKLKFDALPLEEQSRIKFNLCSKGEIVFKCFAVICLVMAGVELFNDNFTFGNITSSIGYVVVIVLMKVGKKKYEVNTETTYQ